MRYSCGMYGGSFHPLHLGHVRDMLSAANQCDKLIIVISYGPNRNEIDIRLRYRWVYETVRHLPNVRLMVMEDEASSKTAYTEEMWLKDAEKVKAFAGEPIKAVFFGSDYSANSMWTKCYPEATPVIFQRDGISSTAIRNDPIACWDMMPAYVRSFLYQKGSADGNGKHGKIHAHHQLGTSFQYCLAGGSGT